MASKSNQKRCNGKFHTFTKLEKMNGIRGVGLNEEQVKTLFPHSTLTVQERELVDTFMPNLKDLPYFSKPHTIMSDVMNVIMGPNEAAQNKVRSSLSHCIMICDRCRRREDRGL